MVLLGGCYGFASCCYGIAMVLLDGCYGVTRRCYGFARC